MTNPFEVLEARLSNIETLLIDLKHQPNQVDCKEQPEQLLSVQETAQFLKLTVATIYSKVRKGELPVMKRSKRLYFSRLELLEYLRVGRRMTNLEISQEAEKYIHQNKA